MAKLVYCCFSVLLKIPVVFEASLLLFSKFLDFNSKIYRILGFDMAEVSRFEDFLLLNLSFCGFTSNEVNFFTVKNSFS